MSLEQIKTRLGRLNALVEGWNGNDISAIERDLALEHLRAIYDDLSSVKNNATAVEAVPQSDDSTIVEPEPVVEPELAVKTEPAVDGAVEAVAAASVETPVAEAEEEPVGLIDDPIDIDALLGLSSPDEEVVATLLPPVEPERVEKIAAEPEPDGDPLPEPQPEPQPEPEVEPAPGTESSAESRETEAAVGEPAPQPEKPAMGGLFDINEIPVRSKRRRNVMISLYEEPARPLVPSDASVPSSSVTAAATAPQRVETERPQSVFAPAERVAESADEIESSIAEPSVEQPDRPETAAGHSSAEQPAQRYTAPVTPTPARPTRLADLLGEEVTTLADSMVGDKPMVGAAAVPIDDLRKAIGINDRFLMIRDLFNGDAQMFENTITTLNEFDDLDECMIYIVENFAWNPDSDGARLLMSLIQRKLA